MAPQSTAKAKSLLYRYTQREKRLRRRSRAETAITRLTNCFEWPEKVIGLDSNVIVRYVAQDDDIQSAAATRLFDSLTPEEAGFVSVVALIETVWMLRSFYGTSRKHVQPVIDTLLRTRGVVLERSAWSGWLWPHTPTAMQTSVTTSSSATGARRVASTRSLSIAMPRTRQV